MNNNFKTLKQQLFYKLDNIMLSAHHHNYGVIFSPHARIFEEELFILTYNRYLYYCESYTNGDFVYPTSIKLSPNQFNRLVFLINNGLKANEKVLDCCDGDIWDITAYSKSGQQTAKFEGYSYNIDRIKNIHNYLRHLLKEKNSFKNRYSIKSSIPHGNYITSLATDKLSGETICLHQQAKNHTGINLQETFLIVERLSNSSPLFMKTYESFEDEKNHYFVTEYISGISLKSMIKNQAIHWKTAIEIVKALAEAIAIAHLCGFLLLNLCPQEIYITNMQAIKIHIHLGHRINPIDTCSPVDLSLPTGYNAPEIYSKNSLGTYTNVYTLGAILYELLTGVPPVDALLRYRGTPLLSISKHCPTAPLELAQIIYKALDLSILNRTDTPWEFYEQLNSLRY